jgi:very-short-patch-repair endonuclease
MHNFPWFPLVILAQVQLLQALQFKRGQRSQALLNRISQLSVDFLILNPNTSIRAAIELDDRSHERADRKQADARKTHALQSVGVPLIRWNTRSVPDIAAIGAAVGAVPVRQPGSRP